jgi:hypothetical protein
MRFEIGSSHVTGEFVMQHRAIATQPWIKLVHVALVVIGATAFTPIASAAKNDLPQVSPDGLKLVPKTKVSAVYLREGADFSGYSKVAILDCFVAFRKNWQRDTNNQSTSRVSDSDVMRIKTELAQEFKQVFSKQLTAKGQTVVSTDGPGVLVLRPAIVNLDIAAPDTMSAGRSTTFTETTGQATLFLELYDGVSNELLARVLDVENAGTEGTFYVRNGVTNRADAQRMLAKWADLLGTYLQNARASATPAKSTTK